MRVLHVIAEMGVGGAETIVAEMVNHGPELGWQESAVASAGGDRVRSVTDAGGQHFHVPLVANRLLSMPRSTLALRRAVRTHDPDVLIAHNVGSTVVAWLARLRRGPALPIVSVFHGVPAKDYAMAARILQRAPDRVVTVSTTIRDRLKAAGLTRLDVSVIPNAVSTPRTMDRRAARDELGLADSDPVAVCVARLVPQKRLDVLLRAWAMIPEPATLLLAGDGELRSELEQLARDLGIESRVRFLGVRRDIGLLLSAADLFTLSSDWEGLPVSALEAMAAGLPVVGTAVDGLTEIVDTSGVLVPRGDSESLASALVDFLSDPVRCRQAGQSAKAAIERNHTALQMLSAYDDVVRSLLEPARW